MLARMKNVRVRYYPLQHSNDESTLLQKETPEYEPIIRMGCRTDGASAYTNAVASLGAGVTSRPPDNNGYSNVGRKNIYAMIVRSVRTSILYIAIRIIV